MVKKPSHASRALNTGDHSAVSGPWSQTARPAPPLVRSSRDIQQEQKQLQLLQILLLLFLLWCWRKAYRELEVIAGGEHFALL